MIYILLSFVRSFQHRSVWFLILANLFPLYGVYFLGWSAIQLIILYWSENVIVGVYNVLKMMFNTNEQIGELKVNGRKLEGSLHAAKLQIIPFFVIHYGMFTLIHGLFLFVMFIAEPNNFSELRAPYLGVNIMMIFLSHGMSFLINYLGKKEHTRTTLGSLMFSPYVRIIAMHMVILIGGFLYMTTGANEMALLILITAKILIDVFSHAKEHRFLNSASSR